VTLLVDGPRRRAWEEDGWCILERAVPPDLLAAAQKAVTRLFPSAAAMAAGDDENTTRWRHWDAAWPEFPYRSRSLNALTVGEDMVALARQLLGTDDVRLYMSLITAKYAGQPSDYNRLLHTDFPNHTLTVPRADRGYQQMETFVYLCDVGADNGATRFVPRSRTADIPVERHTLDIAGHADLYEDPADASAPAGSIVVYRPDVYHRSVDFTDPTRARFMLHVSYRPAAMEWGGYQAWPLKGFSPEWHNFVQQATPDQLSVLGFPPPGHPYWTDETLAGVAGRYPGLDLTPWREG
jgi:ectoine hydroxylase-related dioxygenase (phytanoyl-CoA dioxygenase family)